MIIEIVFKLEMITYYFENLYTSIKSYNVPSNIVKRTD